MNIELIFLTEKAKEVYKNISNAGTKENVINRTILKRIYEEKVISNNPLTIHILFKIRQMQVICQIFDNTKKKLNETLKQNIDYKIEYIP